MDCYMRHTTESSQNVEYVAVTVLKIDNSGALVLLEDSTGKKFLETRWRLVKLTQSEINLS